MLDAVVELTSAIKSPSGPENSVSVSKHEEGTPLIKKVLYVKMEQKMFFFHHFFKHVRTSLI